MGGWGLRGVGRAWREATFCSCHHVSSRHLPEHASWQLLPTAPSDGPQIASLTPRLSGGAQRNLSLHKLCASSYAAPSPSLHPRPSSFLAGRLGHWQNPRREPADHKCQLCVLGPVKSSHLPRLSGDRFIALKVPRRPPWTRTIPHLARTDRMLGSVLKVLSHLAFSFTIVKILNLEAGRYFAHIKKKEH